MAVTLAEVLDERQVVLDLQVDHVREALREVIATLPPAKLRNAEELLREICRREETHTTYVGDGVAFPHARTDLVSEILLGIGRSRGGVPIGENEERAHLLFVIAVPQRMVTDYLVCVGALARITKDEANRAALLGAQSALELVELLREASLLLK